MRGIEDTPLEIYLNEDEIKVLEKMAQNRGVDLDEFINQILSKHTSY